MFTGIIEEVGYVEKLEKNSSTSSLTLRAKTVLEDIQLGDSIAVSGVCLTVTCFSPSSFQVDVMNETWNRTALYQLSYGDPVNLERALPAKGRFGGHLVTGHIDGIGRVKEIRKDASAFWYRIETKKEILELMIEKGSIAIDGISLTVAKLTKRDFSVSVIPHTLEHTILKSKKINDMINLENDMIGKYIKKFVEQNARTGLSKEFLLRNGF